MAKFLDKKGVTALWKRIRNALGGVLVDATSGGDMVSVSKVAPDGFTQVQGVSFCIDFYDYNDSRIPVIVKGDLKFNPASATTSGMLQPADYLKLSELTRPSAGTIAMKKLRTQYLAFATDGTNEIGGLYIEDGHTMIQAKQGTPIKLGWRGGNVGFCMDSNGHAGIGYATGGNLPTIDTSARLTIDGDLRVLGQVIADTPTPPTATKIEANTDLNTLTTPGWYYYDNIEAAYATLAHTPPSQSTCHFLMLVTPSVRESGADNYKTAIFLPAATYGNATRNYFYIRRGLGNRWSKVDLSTIMTTEDWES